MSQWSGAFTATITVYNNTSNPLSGGNLLFVFPGTQTVTQGWNAVYNQNSNTVTAGNLANISPNGGSVTTGFNANWSGSNPNPVEYTLNAVPCTLNS
jgi:hypothetical protein